MTWNLGIRCFIFATIAILVDCGNLWNANFTVKEKQGYLTTEVKIFEYENIFSYSIILVQVNTTDDDCTSGIYVSEKTFSINETVSSANVMLEQTESGVFCFMVKPVDQADGGQCRSDCRSRFSGVFNYDGKGTQEYFFETKEADCLNCSQLSYRLNQVPNRNDLELNLDFGKSICFHEEPFEIDFYNVSKKSSAKFWYLKLNETYLRETRTNKDTVWLIKNLSTEYFYCFSIKPGPRHSCYKDCNMGCYTKTLEITNIDADVTKKDTVKSQSLNWLIYLFIGIFIFIIISVFLCYMENRKPKYSKHRNSNSVPPDETVQTLLEEKQGILIVYSRETDSQMLCIKALWEFINSITKKNVYIDFMEEDEIILKGANWFLEKLDSCEVILLVESQRAVCKQKAIIKGEVLNSDNDDYLDAFFTYQLKHVTSNPANMLGSDHIAVVHFEYTPRSFVLEGVAQNKRYQLPLHLFELIHFLRFGKDYKLTAAGQKQLILEVQSHWAKDQNYHNLLQAIHVATEDAKMDHIGDKIYFTRESMNLTF